MTVELPPDPAVLTREMSRMRSERAMAGLLDSQLRLAPDDLDRPVATFDPSVQHFTDLNTLFAPDTHHALVEGKTGAGKTTLTLSCMKMFMDRGFPVLIRDDGKQEFKYLAKFYKPRIFIPADVITKEGKEDLHIEGFDAEIVRVSSPEEIWDYVSDNKYLLNAFIYDAYCAELEYEAEWYSKLFMSLIHACMQGRLNFEHNKLILAFTELNDIVQSSYSSLSGEHARVRSAIEYNIRKLRKFGVQLWSETHRFTQISLSVRSQFDYYFIKKSFGFDVWGFLNQSLVTANNRTFWTMLKKITSLPPWIFVLFDYNNNYDFYKFPDIPRPNYVCIPTGEIVPEKRMNKKDTHQRDQYRAILTWLEEQGRLSEKDYPEIGKVVGVEGRQVRHLIHGSGR